MAEVVKKVFVCLFFKFVASILKLITFHIKLEFLTFLEKTELWQH